MPCVAVHWVWKLFGFPWDDTGEFRVNLSSLDKVLAYKTIEHLDESVAKDVAVGCNSPGLDLLRGGAKFWDLAQHSQRVLCMFLVKDVVDSVATNLLVHQSSNCCKDMLRNLRSTSVSKGSVIQSRRVILALFNIPFPGRNQDLRLGLSDSSAGDVARRSAASLRLAVAERCCLSDPGLVSVVGRCVIRHVVVGSLHSRFCLRCSSSA